MSKFKKAIKRWRYFKNEIDRIEALGGRIPLHLSRNEARFRARIDIVKAISGYVELKQEGNRYIGICPFHHEITPSFTVNPERQIFHCLGCGQGGNVDRFFKLIGA